jgi:predicted alpha/beta hydrolase
MDATDIELEALDGYPLAATLFEPASRPISSVLVIINAATGVERRYYRAFATHLAEAGATVLTYDYRGIGGSRPASLRGFRAKMEEWGTLDFEGVLEAAKKRFGFGRVRAVGHSVGGQLLGLAPSNEVLDRAVGIGAQLGDYRLWPPMQQARLLALWYGVLPLLTKTFGYLPGQAGIGADLPAGVALQWSRWCKTPGYFAGDGGDHVRDGFARMHVNYLAVSMEHDFYAPKKTVDALSNLFQGARMERWHLEDPKIGHFGFFRERNWPYWERVTTFLLDG